LLTSRACVFTAQAQEPARGVTSPVPASDTSPRQAGPLRAQSNSLCPISLLSLGPIAIALKFHRLFYSSPFSPHTHCLFFGLEGNYPSFSDAPQLMFYPLPSVKREPSSTFRCSLVQCADLPVRHCCYLCESVRKGRVGGKTSGRVGELISVSQPPSLPSSHRCCCCCSHRRCR